MNKKASIPATKPKKKRAKTPAKALAVSQAPIWKRAPIWEHGGWTTGVFESAEQLRDKACEYFQWCDKNPWYETKFQEGRMRKIPTARPYTIVGLCNYIVVSQSYFRKAKEFRRSVLADELQKHNHVRAEEFLEVIEWIEGVCYQQKFEGAAVGAFQATIIARDLGLKESTEVSNPPGQSFNINTTHEVIFKRFSRDDHQPDGQ